ncbi:hypothetical protein GLOIN_2v1571020 [Rhizophagus clarus]|uniref:Uncharacterized protein n=1 Tax=Rhizophagus clarus TaxID=94130 RepID=A0A8H3M2K1_9GLOM|nr:hypothetical protein GLOIN_2v1571020 [Rhizophagus clarus]
MNINIKEELEGVELKLLSKISKYFPFQLADKHIHIIVQYPVEIKEVYCTVTYRTEDEHIIINYESRKECIHLGFNMYNLVSRIQSGPPNYHEHMFDKMKTLFSLKADDYNELPTFVRGVKEMPEEI